MPPPHDRSRRPSGGTNLDVEVVRSPQGWAQALALLDRAVRAAGVPLVDEAERRRIEAVVAATTDAIGAPIDATFGARFDTPPGWQVLLVRRDGDPVGYGALVIGAADADAADAQGAADAQDAADARGAAQRPTASGDVALDVVAGADGAALSALLREMAAFAAATRRDQDGGDLIEVWLRHAGRDELTAAASVGFQVARRLAVLGRHLDVPDTTTATTTATDPAPDTATDPAPGDDGPAAPDDPSPAPGVTIRAYRPDVDDAEVVAVLAAAYAGTADGGWDLDAFRERRSWSWFRPEDLLVAEVEGRVAGVHWLKRRSERVGEVHNLAVHPDAQGRRVGPALLTAGLDHLRSIGCDEVLLWVDLANDRAVAMYRDHGFSPRWEDVALVQR